MLLAIELIGRSNMHIFLALSYGLLMITLRAIDHIEMLLKGLDLLFHDLLILIDGQIQFIIDVIQTDLNLIITLKPIRPRAIAAVVVRYELRADVDIMVLDWVDVLLQGHAQFRLPLDLAVIPDPGDHHGAGRSALACGH